MEKSEQLEANAPADEVDDGAVVQARVCCARASLFIRQLQNVILVRERLAHLTAADHSTALLYAHSYNPETKGSSFFQFDIYIFR